MQDITTFSHETQRYFVAAVRPNGQEFVVVKAGDPSQEFADLVLGDMESGALQPDPLYRPAEGRWPEAPTWNAEGTKVAFLEIGTTDYDNMDVRIVDVESQEVYTAFSVSWVDDRPTNLSWARTSNELLLDVDGLVYRVDLDVATPALGVPIAEGTHAVWSPDDTQIAYLDKFIYVQRPSE